MRPVRPLTAAGGIKVGNGSGGGVLVSYMPQTNYLPTLVLSSSEITPQGVGGA